MPLRSKEQCPIRCKERECLVEIGIYIAGQQLQRRPTFVGLMRNVQVETSLNIIAIGTYKSNCIKHIHKVYILVVLVVSQPEEIGFYNDISIKHLSSVRKMEIAALHLAVGHNLKHIGILPQVVRHARLSNQIVDLRNHRRTALGCTYKVFAVSTIECNRLGKQIFAVICKSKIIIGLLQIIIVCQSKVFYSLVVLISQHNHRSATIIVEYGIGCIPAMQLRETHVCICVVGRLEIGHAGVEQRNLSLRILLDINKLCILRRQISDTG